MRLVLPLFILCLLACAGSTPLANFKVKKQEVDASCTKLTDFCLRATCTIKNDSQVPGQAVVEIQLVDPKGEVLFSETERADLGAGDTHTLTHEFTQAKLGTEATAKCVVR